MKITEIDELELDITSANYENIFNVYKDKNDFYFFNLLRKIDFPIELSPDTFDYYQVQPDDFYPLLAYRMYKDIRLWWIICAVNQIDDPCTPPKPGTIIKLLIPELVPMVLSKLKKD